MGDGGLGCMEVHVSDRERMGEEGRERGGGVWAVRMSASRRFIH